MPKINSSGSGKSIYGNVPDNAAVGQAKKAFDEAMDNADEYWSNKINGSTDSETVRYNPEEGE